MKESIRSKLEQITDRFEEITALLADPSVQSDQNQFRDLSREYAQVEPVAMCFRDYRRSEEDRVQAEEMLADPEMTELAREALTEAEQRQAALEPELQRLLLPRDPNDERNVFLEIRAGTGGDEAALFAGDLCRMYLRYAEQRGWRSEIVSESLGEPGGYKEVIVRIVGQGRLLAAEVRIRRPPGAARAGDRIPGPHPHLGLHGGGAAGGRRGRRSRASTRATCASTPTAPPAPAASTSTRPTRRCASPTCRRGIVVECQDERSQHKNKARAMSLLQAKLLSSAQAEQHQAQAADRKLQVGSGDRSERIRTYNFPQNRLTDHRINLTLYKLDEVMEGALDPVIDPLVQEYQAEQLTALNEGV